MKTVVLTGGTTGIGQAILDKLLADEQYNVFVITKNAHRLNIESSKLHILQCDLCDERRILDVIDSINSSVTNVDILINNAGIGIFRNIEDITLMQWQQVLAINLTAPFLLMRGFMQKMKEHNYGRIINISSDAGYSTFSQGGVYCASKFALHGLTGCVRYEVKPYNIAITNICPGRVDTCFNGKKPGDRPCALSPLDVANQVVNILNQTERCGIEEIRLTSTLE